jgi:hypothetical protein
MHAHDRLAVTLLADEAADPRRLELVPGGAMTSYNIAAAHPSEPSFDRANVGPGSGVTLCAVSSFPHAPQVSVGVAISPQS